MKCLCGYDDEDKEKKFIHVELSNHIKPQVYKGWSEYQEVNLYACPECKTVKMVTWLD